MFNFKVSHWFRILARFCDYSMFFIFSGALSLALPYFYGPFFYYYLALAIPLFWVPLEAFFVSKWGTTPGKALFGLSVRDAAGSILSYIEAFKWSLFLPQRKGVVRQKNISWKRKLTGFVASITFILAALYGNVIAIWSVGLEGGVSPEKWVKYASDDAHFKVSFPKDPDSASKELVIPESDTVLNYKEITSEQGRKIRYSVSHMELPKKWRWAGNATLLKEVLNQIVKHTEGATLVDKEFDLYQSNRVLDFRMKQYDDEVKGRLILVSGILYKLTITYPSSQTEQMQHDPFLDSFETTS